MCTLDFLRTLSHLGCSDATALVYFCVSNSDTFCWVALILKPSENTPLPSGAIALVVSTGQLVEAQYTD